jgi:hypothetical protein
MNQNPAGLTDDEMDEYRNIALAMRIHGSDFLSEEELARYRALLGRRGGPARRVNSWYQLDAAKWAWSGDAKLLER